MESILKNEFTYRVRLFSSLRHLPSVMDTESAYENGWSEHDVITFFGDKTSIIKVAMLPGRDYVVGHAFFTVLKKVVSCHGIRVKPGFRAQGVASTLLGDAKAIAMTGQRHTLLIPVDEDDVQTQIWLRNRGIRCTRMHSSTAKYIFEWSKG